MKNKEKNQAHEELTGNVVPYFLFDQGNTENITWLSFIVLMS